MRLYKFTVPAEKIRKAYGLWHQTYPFRDTDQLIQGTVNIEFKKQNNWLEQARQALLITKNEMAKRLGISRWAYSQFESSEAHEKISIATLRKAAEVMDCELVYFIRPKKNVVFSKLIWEKLEAEILNLNQVYRNLEKASLPSIISNIAKNKMLDAGFRKKQKWVRNHR
jgi:transcriptional regulator with XRE-family HTH domain